MHTRGHGTSKPEGAAALRSVYGHAPPTTNKKITSGWWHIVYRINRVDGSTERTGGSVSLSAC